MVLVNSSQIKGQTRRRIQCFYSYLMREAFIWFGTLCIHKIWRIQLVACTFHCFRFLLQRLLPLHKYSGDIFQLIRTMSKLCLAWPFLFGIVWYLELLIVFWQTSIFVCFTLSLRPHNSLKTSEYQGQCYS